MIGAGPRREPVGLIQLATVEGGEHLVQQAGEARAARAQVSKGVGRRFRSAQLRGDRAELAGRDWLGRTQGVRTRCTASRRERADGTAGRQHGVLRMADLDGGGREERARRLVSTHDGSGRRAGRVEPRSDRVAQLVERGDRHHGPVARQALGGQAGRRIGGSRPEEQCQSEDRQSRRCRGRHAYHGWVVSADALRSLPKAELHQHLDGSVRPTTAVQLADAMGRTIGLDEARLRMVGPEHCESQAELLAFFDLPISLLQTADALQRVTAELVEDLMHDGVRYAEIRWAPRLHLGGGLSVQSVLEAVAAGIEQAASVHGPSVPMVGLIVTAMRSHPPAANVGLARSAAAFGPPILGFDLAGPEQAWPAPPHAAAFIAARDGGLALTAHAGEVPGAQRVREVLEFGVRRVAHGLTAVDDETLISLLRARDITLDLCPTSNVQAGVVPDLSSHPIGALHRAGVSVTMSTDDRTVTGISLSEEMARTAAAVGLTDEELAAIALNAFDRAFAPRTELAPIRAAAARAWSAWRSGVDIS